MFVGRNEELQAIRALVARQSPSIGIIYGRRRIGKSALIRKSLENTNALFFEGLENQSRKKQLDNFLFQLSNQVSTSVDHKKVQSWKEAFMLLYPILKEHPACIVLDEFQWMANYRSEIVADLKMVWEQYLSGIQGNSLLLCGSIASFMTTKVVKSNALYGRTDLEIHLDEFHLKETAQMLHAHGFDEVINAQICLGGVPKYIDLVRDEPSIQLAIEKLAFSKNGYFLEEYNRIFTSHFGKHPNYEKIIKILAKYPYGLFRGQLAEKISLAAGGRLSEHLTNLEFAGFISSTPPIDKSEESRLTKYSLSDSYLRFYFAFILPNLKKIKAGIPKHIFANIVQTGRFNAWRGRAFEYLCIDHASRIAEILGFSGVDFTFGPYFRSSSKKDSGVQIDLLFDRADKVLTLCEMKWSTVPLKKSIIQEVERKTQILKAKFPSRTVQRVLIIHGDISQGLSELGYFYKIIRSIELV